MAKKKPTRKGFKEFLTSLPIELADVLDAHVASIEPATSRNAVVLLLIREGLERRKLWPPRAAAEG